MWDLRETATPALVLDLPALRVNARFMAERAKVLGLRLRPHMKTAKSADVARLVTAGQFGGICVSTLTEAEHFFAAGFQDITLAVGFLPDRLPRALALARHGVRLTVLVDDAEAARSIAAGAAGLAPLSMDVLLEVDCGDHRGGVRPDSAELIEIAEQLHDKPGVRLAGVLTHAGHSYRAADVAQVQAIAREERDAAVLAANRLREAGFPCETVSVGSTPTCTHALEYSGCTEMRPGVYMFGDLDQVGLGSLPEDRIAVQVLCSVIGVYPRQNKVIVDAGGLALSKDAGAQRHGAGIGYGKVLDVEGKPVAGARVFACSQEHGQITAEGPLPVERLGIGTRLRILPNHICMTAAAHQGYHVVEGGTAVVAQWPRVNGWE